MSLHVCQAVGKFLKPVEIFTGSVRNASKKAAGSSRNSKSSSGQYRQIRIHDGGHIKIYDILATQRKLNWLPGLNVGIAGRHTLVALKEGTVIFTCEKPDLDMEKFYNQKYYTGREGQTFYKKYAHVIPTPQHKKFKLISQT